MSNGSAVTQTQTLRQTHTLKHRKSDNGFARIAAQPLLEPLLNMHTASYMSMITYLNMLGSSNPYICDDMELPYTKGHTSDP